MFHLKEDFTMNLLAQIITVIALLLTIGVPVGIFMHGERTKTRYKKTLAVNVIGFFGLLLTVTVVSLAGTQGVHAAGDSASIATGLGYIGAALVTGLSGIGSGIGVASSASAALGAISEDGSIFGKAIIFVAMAEGIALFGLIISFMILGKL